MDNATKKTIEEQIEKLAIMVAKGFETTATKEEMNERFDNLESEMNDRFDKVESSIDKIYQELDGIRDNARVLKTRVDRLEVVGKI